jgi:hypothetical protein
VTDLYIEGVALDVSRRDTSRSLTDLIFDTVRAAVDDSGQNMSGIDSVVLAAHDLVDGRSLSSMVTAPAAAAYLRDEIRFGDDSAGAFAAAVTRLEAGHNQRTIVAGWGRASEHDVAAFSHRLFDPFFGQPVGLDEMVVSGLRAQSYLQRYGAPGRDRAAAARASRAAGNPRGITTGSSIHTAPYPLRDDDLPVWADVCVALVMSTEPTPIRVAGLGQSTDPYQIGDRDLVAMPALADAVGKALAEAGCGVGDLDLVELDVQTAFDEALAVEAIGLAAPGTGFDYVAGTPGFNPSGGSAAGYCAPAMGLTRIVEAVLQLRGAAGAVQQGSPRRVLATGSSTIAAQTHTAIVLEAS